MPLPSWRRLADISDRLRSFQHKRPTATEDKRVMNLQETAEDNQHKLLQTLVPRNREEFRNSNFQRSLLNIQFSSIPHFEPRISNPRTCACTSAARCWISSLRLSGRNLDAIWTVPALMTVRFRLWSGRPGPNPKPPASPMLTWPPWPI